MNIEFARQVGTAKFLWRTFLRQFTKRVLMRDNVITLPTGLTMILPRWDTHATEVYVTNCATDWGAEEVLSRFLDQSADFIDVGAHTGYYSKYMAPLVHGVCAFEPDPRCLTALQNNLNQLQHARIERKAVGSERGRMRLSIASDSAVSHLVATETSPSEPTVEVEVETIDHYVAEYDLKVTAIKIDVEGWDFQVLLGARHVMATQSPLVLAEIQPTAELKEFCDAIDFAMYGFALSDGRKPRFVRFDANDSRRAKMVFLVPSKLKSDFEALVSQ